MSEVPRPCKSYRCPNPALPRNAYCPTCLDKLQRTGWQEPTYAPIALYVRAPQPQRKNSSKADRS